MPPCNRGTLPLQDYYEKGTAYVNELVSKFNKKDELWWVNAWAHTRHTPAV